MGRRDRELDGEDLIVRWSDPRAHRIGPPPTPPADGEAVEERLATDEELAAELVRISEAALHAETRDLAAPRPATIETSARAHDELDQELAELRLRVARLEAERRLVLHHVRRLLARASREEMAEALRALGWWAAG